MWTLFKALSAFRSNLFIFRLLYYPEEQGLLRLQHRHFGNEKNEHCLGGYRFWLSFIFPVLEPFQPLSIPSDVLLPKKKGEGKIVWVYCRFLSAM
jgi:hypothetical protein